MQIGIVAKKMGVSVDAIRFYERKGLLPQAPRTEGGFRRYGENDVETLALVRRVQRSGVGVASNSNTERFWHDLRGVPNYGEESAAESDGRLQNRSERKQALTTFDEAKTNMDAFVKATTDAWYPSKVEGSTKKSRVRLKQKQEGICPAIVRKIRINDPCGHGLPRKRSTF